jgi:hypothetical protein
LAIVPAPAASGANNFGVQAYSKATAVCTAGEP